MSRRSTINRALRSIEKLHARIDDAMKIAADRHDITCRKGCTACCRFGFLSTVPEALIALRATEGKLWFGRDAGPANKINKQARMIFDPTMTVDKWYEARVACPMLLANNACGIYDARPTRCRVYSVVSDPADCGKRGKISMVEIEGWANVLVMASTKAAQDMGCPTGLAPFPIALQWASIVNAEGPDALRRHLANTPYADELTSSRHWMERFGSDDYAGLLEEISSGEGLE